MYTDDPIADFLKHDKEQARWLVRLPLCVKCEEHIQQEDVLCIDGKYYCDNCLENMREPIDD